MSTESYVNFESLNPQQLEAVKHVNGPILIFAGAGSGKTRVIVYRMVNLIQNAQVQPWNILAVTFTNKAANEMKNRMAEILGDSVAQSLNAGTFHSICARILRREHEKTGLIANFTIIDDSEQITRIKRAMSICGISSDRMEPKSAAAAISHAKTHFIDPETMAREAGFNVHQKFVSEIYAEYDRRLGEDHAVDFDDLLVKAVKLLKDNIDVREKYQDRFKFILVDEYQDTNQAQYKFIEILASRYRNLMVVGDDDQSIYKWRGADISNILNFNKDFPGAKVIKLEQNYRSSQIILSAASELMKNNLNRTPKNLWTDQQGGEKIRCSILRSDREEANYIIRQINRLVSMDSRGYGDFSVFYRTNAQSRVLEEAFIASRLPYRVVGQVGFFRRKEIKDLLAYIRLVLNPYDSQACLRIINTPKRGIGKATQEEIQKVADTHSLDYFSAVEKALKENLIQGFKLERAAQFVEIIHDLIRVSRTSTVDFFINYLVDATNYCEQFEIQNSPESEASLEIVREFQTAAIDFHKRSEGKLSDFADYLALNQTDTEQEASSEKDKADQVISLMTLHNAKGLEFPVVFITGMEEGLCPHFWDPNDFSTADLEEERRLVYVGMTRAKEQLFMTGAFQRMRNGKLIHSSPSRFLLEIPETYKLSDSTSSRGYQRRHYQEKVDVIADNPANLATNVVSPTAINEFNKGDRVLHKNWGVGLILEISGSGPESKVTVRFDRVGKRKLLLGPARLVKVQ